MFTMDQATFGLPNWNLSQTQQDQFKALPSQVGRGLYRDYNPTGPIPVTMQWTFDNDQMRAFNEAWIDRAKFAWGAAWFYLDLPLGLDDGDASTDLPRTVEVPHTFQVGVASDGADSLGWWKGIRGSIEPAVPTINGSELFEFRYNTSNSLMFAPTVDGNPIPHTPGLSFRFPNSAAGSGQEYLAAWSSGSLRYQFTVDQNITDHWVDGASVPLIVSAEAPLWRKYRCTPTGNRQTQMIGPHDWSVSLPVLVDQAPATDWMVA